MAGEVYEWYGYRTRDNSRAALEASQGHHCPFVPPTCTKNKGACSVSAGGQVVIICPKRLYGNDYELLRLIAHEAFDDFDVNIAMDGLPSLIDAASARRQAQLTGRHQVGVFGAGWGGELKLPPVAPGGSRYSVDFTLIVVSPDGSLQGLCPVEVQTIDTTGNYDPSIAALRDGRRVVPSSLGLNWENVNKRILPQLITKGLMLQGERLCRDGLFFVSPEPVYQRIMTRLGGDQRFRRIPRQPGSITFVRYLHSPGVQDGTPASLGRMETVTISTSDMSLAFISPQNLPPAGAYEAQILRRI